MHHNEDSDGAEVKFQLKEKEECCRLIKIHILQSCLFRRQHVSGTAYFAFPVGQTIFVLRSNQGGCVIKPPT